MPRDPNLFPFGVYDTKECAMAYIGLHVDETDAWRVFLGWPDQEEIDDAKALGLRVLPLTINYEPPR